MPENIPASNPFSQARCAGVKGALSGTKGMLAEGVGAVDVVINESDKVRAVFKNGTCARFYRCKTVSCRRNTAAARCALASFDE
jgi:hypothetical protein